MVFRRDTEGDVRSAKDCQIVVYSCPLDNLQTETKGTVLINTADELKDFSKVSSNVLASYFTLLQVAFLVNCFRVNFF